MLSFVVQDLLELSLVVSDFSLWSEGVEGISFLFDIWPPNQKLVQIGHVAFIVANISIFKPLIVLFAVEWACFVLAELSRDLVFHQVANTE